MWLVQRIEKNDSPREGAKGVDSIVRFDYMGSAEFEWGALPKALKFMREVAALSTEKIVLQKVEHVMRDEKDKKVTHKAYFVGPASHAVLAKEFFISELTYENKVRLKEPTMIRHAYGPEGEETAARYKRLVGWWVIDGEPPWALFKDEAIAREWMKLAYIPLVPSEKK